MYQVTIMYHKQYVFKSLPWTLLHPVLCQIWKYIFQEHGNSEAWYKCCDLLQCDINKFHIEPKKLLPFNVLEPNIPNLELRMEVALTLKLI